jgi:hypothetical protein
MSYQNLLLNNINTTLLVKKSMHDEIQSSIEKLIVLHKLLDYRVDIGTSGTRVVKISFHKDATDNFQIQLQKIQGRLHSVDAYFPLIKKDKLLGLFGRDMDLVVDYRGHNVKVFSHIDTGMLKILSNIGSM